MNKKDVKTMIKFGSMAVFMASVAGCSYYLTEKLEKCVFIHPI